MTEPPLLEVRDLTIGFGTVSSVLPVVRGVSFRLASGEALGLVGESGSGKSVTCRALMGLLPATGDVLGGSVRLEGEELTGAGKRALRAARGRRVGMVFQDPSAALNPTFSIGDQLAETLRRRCGLGRAAARSRAVALLERVEIARAAERLTAYPHELSGGMRQRVMIALAIAPEPRLLIADEPTTALDVTIQAQILELLSGLRRETGMGLLLVSHDLGVVADVCERVAVMYAGEIAEEAPAGELFARPAHPYTTALMRARPETAIAAGARRLEAIPGQLPDFADLAAGCVFAERCTRADERCRTTRPELHALAEAHSAACWHPVGAFA